MENVIFGTDGLRGKINKSLTPRVAYNLGNALALFLKQNSMQPKICVAKDTRTSCDMLYFALSSALLASGVDVFYLEETTTPSLAFLTKQIGASLGVMITASHNQYDYNGFKFFSSKGIKLDQYSMLKIQNNMQYSKCDLLSADNLNIGKLIVCQDKKDIYLNYLQKEKNKVKNISNFSLCFDCANGASYNIIKKLFPSAQMFGDKLYEDKENLFCGALYPNQMQKNISLCGADFGFCFDGDADRLIVVLKSGKILDGDDLLYLFSKFYKQKGKLKKNEVVGTILTNFGVELALSRLDIKLSRQNVGDKYICNEMRVKSLIIGAEQAGHIIIRNKDNLIGDAVLACIKFLSIASEINDIEKYISDCDKFNQISENVKVKEEMLNLVLEKNEFKTFLELCENELGARGRIVVRKSGTESVIRIMVEGENAKKCSKICALLKQKILKLAK